MIDDDPVPTKCRYTQCELTNGAVRQIAYIPDRNAKLNNLVSLRVHGRWSTGWTVTKRYNTITREELPDVHDEVKQHRKNTGDSLPKKKPKS